jgi:hypothetical protein
MLTPKEIVNEFNREPLGISVPAYQHAKPAEAAADLRRQLLGDKVTERELGAALGYKSTAIRSMIAKGCPFTKFGRRRYFSIAEVRSWIEAQSTSVNRNARPPVGRPAKVLPRRGRLA